MNRIMNSPPDSKQISTPDARFSWKSEVAFVLVLVCSVSVGQFAMAWWSGRQVRPFQLIGVTAYLSVFAGLGARRRWTNARAGGVATPWYRFSMAELLIIVTGFALLSGFGAADYAERTRTQRERQRLTSLAAAYLGPDGRLGFNSNGEVTITVCDRTFDDQRFASIAALIDEANLGDRVCWLLFGTGANTAGTPAIWPGFTDQSIDILLDWNNLRWLSLHGTSITPEGRDRLSRLQALEKFNF